MGGATVVNAVKPERELQCRAPQCALADDAAYVGHVVVLQQLLVPLHVPLLAEHGRMRPGLAEDTEGRKVEVAHFPHGRDLTRAATIIRVLVRSSLCRGWVRRSR